MSVFAAPEPKCGLGAFGHLLPCSQQDRSMVSGSRERRSGLPASVPLGRGHSVWWDRVSMPSSRSKTNQIIQDIFSTVRAEHQGELSGMVRNADLHQKSKYKPCTIACHRFFFPLPLFMTVISVSFASIYSYLGSQACIFHLPRWAALLCEG